MMICDTGIEILKMEVHDDHNDHFPVEVFLWRKQRTLSLLTGEDEEVIYGCCLVQVQ